MGFKRKGDKLMCPHFISKRNRCRLEWEKPSPDNFENRCMSDREWANSCEIFNNKAKNPTYERDVASLSSGSTSDSSSASSLGTIGNSVTIFTLIFAIIGVILAIISYSGITINVPIYAIFFAVVGLVIGFIVGIIIKAIRGY